MKRRTIVAAGGALGVLAALALVIPAVLPGPYARAVQAEKEPVGARIFTPDSLSSALPSVAYVYGDKTLRASSSIVVGSFSQPVEVSAPVGSDGEDAAWKRGRITLSIERNLISSPEVVILRPGDQIVVDCYFNPTVDVSAALQDLSTYGTSLVFLQGGFASDPAFWSIAENGALVAPLNEDGSFNFPSAVGGSDGSEQVAGISVDIADLGELARASRTIRVAVD